MDIEIQESPRQISRKTKLRKVILWNNLTVITYNTSTQIIQTSCKQCNCLRGSPNHTRFGSSIELPGLSMWLYSCLWFITVKEYQAKLAKGKGARCEICRTPGASLQVSSPRGVTACTSFPQHQIMTTHVKCCPAVPESLLPSFPPSLFLFISLRYDDICLTSWRSMISIIICHIMGRVEKNDIPHDYTALTVWTVLLYVVGPDRLLSNGRTQSQEIILLKCIYISNLKKIQLLHPYHPVDPICPSLPPFQEIILYKTGITKSFMLILQLEIGPERVYFLCFAML